MPEILTAPPWKLEQIVQAAREQLDDLPGDVVDEAAESWQSNDEGLLWSNAELARWADEAQQQFTKRRPINDNATAAVCQIAVVADTPTYAYHSAILQIEDAYIIETAATTHRPLVKLTHAELREQRPIWRSDTSGTPEFYIEDLTERAVTLYRTPDLAGIMYLTVKRTALQRLSWNVPNTLLEVPAEHQYDLLDWIFHRAFSKDDIETKDERRSEKHLAAFNASIGVLPSAARRQLLREERNTYRRTRPVFF
jgi:hypothetical protein